MVVKLNGFKIQSHATSDRNGTFEISGLKINSDYELAIMSEGHLILVDNIATQ